MFCLNTQNSEAKNDFFYLLVPTGDEDISFSSAVESWQRAAVALLSNTEFYFHYLYFYVLSSPEITSFLLASLLSSF